MPNQFTEKKTHCSRGHPNIPENRQGLSCKICRKLVRDAKAVLKTEEQKLAKRRDMFETGGTMSIQHPNRKFTYEESSFRSLHNRYKQNSRTRGKEFLLPVEEFTSLVSSNCAWCGSPPFETYNAKEAKTGYTQEVFKNDQRERGWVLYNGLDRIDNSKGYTSDNVRPCCKWCNFARNIQTAEEFRSWIKRVHDFQFCGIIQTEDKEMELPGRS